MNKLEKKGVKYAEIKEDKNTTDTYPNWFDKISLKTF